MKMIAAAAAALLLRVLPCALAFAGWRAAGPAPAFAAQTRIAVAANFTDAAQEIAAAFAKATGHEAILSYGSSAQLLAQIAQGAPFEAFLSADEERPARAIADRLALADSRFTYAVGRLVLWSRDPGAVTGEATLRAGAFARIAIANPAAAPYGAAAVETLKALGVYEAIQSKVVQGASIAQAFQFVDTGNAELGFVALSQVAASPKGSRWLVPQALHRPIRQDAVLLASGEGSEAARAFLAYLKGPQARAAIERYGYETAKD
ncbi:molybdate ABC transporter substrate-binding protein [Alsobacter sp. SYSU BS001988]